MVFASALLRAASADVRLNSIGYPPNRAKIASVLNTGAGSFDVRRVSDNVSVFNAALSASATNADTGENIRQANFTALSTPGNYYLDAAGKTSVNFLIADNVYEESLRIQMLGLYGLRCGTAVSFNYGGDTFAHGACHLGDGDLNYHPTGPGSKDGVGGWHDAGDYGKYTVNSSFATGMMLRAWEDYKPALEVISYTHLPASEQSNAIPDFLDELKWNLDWQIKMIFPNGEVAHKLTRTNFSGFVMPTADGATRYFTPYSTAATATFAAVMAQASRVYAPYDAAFAAACLNAANAAYAYLVANTANVSANLAGFSTGGYQTNDADDRIWAAAEIWETTGSAAALADFETRIGWAGDKTDANFDWGNTRNLGTITYLRSMRSGKSTVIENDIINDMVNDANTIRNNSNVHGYGRGLFSYVWGYNGAVARQAMVLRAADYASPDPSYRDAVVQQISHLYGRNYNNRSKITGEGINPPMFPHHRPSGSDGIVNPWPGLLVGGGWPGATDWVDLEASYQTNENAINWTGAMVYALASTLIVPAVSTPTNTPSLTNSPSTTPSSTPTPMDTASLTATFTSTPVNTYTATATPTDTPLNTATATATVSSTPTASPTASATASDTKTSTPSPTFTQPPLSSTRTFTPTLSPTATITATFTPLSTQSSTPQPTATSSFTKTNTSTATRTASETVTASFTPTATASFTQTFTVSATPTFSQTALPGSATATSTPTVSFTVSRTPTIAVFTQTPTVMDTTGVLLISSVVAAPNPVGAESKVYIQLQGAAQRLRLEIFTSAFQKIDMLEVQGSFSGLTTMELPSAFINTASNGLYYGRVLAFDGDRQAKPKTFKMLLLR